MALTRYRNKRNFQGTPEPKGAEPPRSKKAEGGLRFVIQLHDASRKHYDLRLELDGTMKSWAVPKGPSLDPLERRLAVEVEDHPMEYNEFEGVIPRGHYGAGVVMIWDEGTYNARAVDFPAKDEADALRRGYAKGHMTFILHGQKLQGEFALIRLAKSEGSNWLLVKKHDKHASRAEVTHQDRSARSGRTLGEIATNAPKEGKIWSSRKAGSAPDTAEEKEAKAKRGRVAAEEKTKRGSTAAEAKAKRGRVAAEAKAKRSKKGPKESAKAPKFSERKTLAPRFRKIAMEESIPALMKTQAWQPASAVPLLADEIIQPMQDGYRAQLMISAEGKVSLHSKSNLAITKRFPDLAEDLGRIKGPLVLDGLIVPIDEQGEARRRGQLSNKGAAHYAFFVYDLLHADGWNLGPLPLHERLSAWKDMAPTHDVLRFVEAIPKRPEGVTVLLRAGSEAINGPTAPRTCRNVSSDRRAAVPQPATQVQGSRHSVVARNNKGGEQRVSLSNLGKIYWPQEKISKGDLVDFYRYVAPLMVPHLQGRPQSLHRHPNGIAATGFFQKEVAGALPGWMPTATISSGRSGKTVTYALCGTEAELLCLVNLGCIEINSWLSRVDAINSPDYIVVDLDPSEVAFDTVIEAAKTVRRVLDEIGAPSFCKTSGSRGLHIYVPITGAESFDDGRIFAQQFCEELHRRLPQTTSLERSPDRRRGLIYLDYLQNRIGQTMASIYSVRPKANATVSTPLRWTEVKRGLDPSAFTIATLPKRLDRIGDLWENIRDEAVSLESCQAALDELIRRRG